MGEISVRSWLRILKGWLNHWIWWDGRWHLWSWNLELKHWNWVCLCVLWFFGKSSTDKRWWSSNTQQLRRSMWFFKVFFIGWGKIWRWVCFEHASCRKHSSITGMKNHNHCWNQERISNPCKILFRCVCLIQMGWWKCRDIFNKNYSWSNRVICCLELHKVSWTLHL